MEKNLKKLFTTIIIASVLISAGVGGLAGYWAGALISDQAKTDSQTDSALSAETEKILKIKEESAVITAVEKVSPAVVSIIVTKDLPIIERYHSDPFGSDFFRQFFGPEFDDFFMAPQYQERGTERREIGGGTGFLASADGYIITNKHVVIDEEAEYTVLMNDETKYEAEVLARDPFNDIAILKIKGEEFPFVEFGDSSGLKVGQSVIAIGNALGEFRNTVSTGVISGLSRSIIAGGVGIDSKQLIGVIQTDASINVGNSGGPLLNLAGQVIGMNTAMAVRAENIGFAIPINEVKDVYENVKEYGRIVRPWLGVRYVQIDEQIAQENKLDVDYGALIIRGERRTDLAVIPGSPADKAGLTENDIILEINGQKLDRLNPLAKAIGGFKPGEAVVLKILHKGEEKEVKAILSELE